MTKTYTNLQAKAVVLNPSIEQYQLEMFEPSVFASAQAQGTIQTVTLWSKTKEPKQEDQATIKQTQEVLREALGDPNIVFSGVNRDPNNPNDIVNWVAAHPNAPIKLATQDDKGYFHLGENKSGSNYGDSKYLPTWKGQGPYTQNQRVLFFQALPEHLREQFLNEDGPNIVKNNGWTNMNTNGVIVDVILTTANSRDEQHQPTTRAVLKDQILKQLSQSPTLEPVAAQIQELPEDYALADLIQIIGGTNADNLAADPLAKSTVPALIKNATRGTAAFNIANDETGMIFKSTAFKLPRGSKRPPRASLAFEYIVGDFTPNDLNRLLLDVPGMSTDEVLAALTEANFYDTATNQLKYQTPQEALDAMRSVFNHREVKVNSLISGPNMNKDPEKIGTRVEHIGEVTEIPVYIGTQMPNTSTNVQQMTNPLNTAQPATETTVTVNETVTADPFSAASPVTEQPSTAQTQPVDPFSAITSATPSQPTIQTTATPDLTAAAQQAQASNPVQTNAAPAAEALPDNMADPFQNIQSVESTNTAAGGNPFQN